MIVVEIVIFIILLVIIKSRLVDHSTSCQHESCCSSECWDTLCKTGNWDRFGKQRSLLIKKLMKKSHVLGA